MYVNPGMVFRAGHSVVKTHGQFFMRLCLVVEQDEDLAPTEAHVGIVGQADDNAPFTFVLIKVAGSVATGETSLYNVDG